MESQFVCSVPSSAPISRGLVLSLSAQLYRLAKRERGTYDMDIGVGITLFCGADTMHFSNAEELAACVPPLARINGFHMSVLFNPWHVHENEPSLSLYVHKPAGSSKFTVIAEASTQSRAQELALEIADSLPGSSSKVPEQKQRKREPKCRKRADRNGKEPQKFYHSGTFWAAVGALATVAATVIALLALLHSFGFL